MIGANKVCRTSNPSRRVEGLKSAGLECNNALAHKVTVTSSRPTIWTWGPDCPLLLFDNILIMCYHKFASMKLADWIIKIA